MTPQDFQNWLADVKSAGLSKSDAETARLLGITPRHILNYKKNGTSRLTSLACSAVLARLKPYVS